MTRYGLGIFTNCVSLFLEPELSSYLYRIPCNFYFFYRVATSAVITQQWWRTNQVLCYQQTVWTVRESPNKCIPLHVERCVYHATIIGGMYSRLGFGKMKIKSPTWILMYIYIIFLFSIYVRYWTKWDIGQNAKFAHYKFLIKRSCWKFDENEVPRE